MLRRQGTQNRRSGPEYTVHPWPTGLKEVEHLLGPLESQDAQPDEKGADRKPQGIFPETCSCRIRTRKSPDKATVT